MKDNFFKHASGQFNVLVPSHVIDDLVHFCSQDLVIETGGILIGKYSSDSFCAIVKKADGAPIDSTKGRTWFMRGVSGLKNMLKQLWQDEKLFYLGEWHYHPYSSPSPSGTDKRAMIEIASRDESQCRTPILLIIGGDVSKKPLISVSVVTSDKKFIRLKNS